MLETASSAPASAMAAWLLGTSMGLTACTVTCMPFIGTWALGHGGGRLESFAHTGAFLAGRIVAYALLGALAGALGGTLAKTLGGSLGNVAIGGASVAAGLWLLARPRLGCGATTGDADIRVVRFHRQPPARDALPPVLLGAALSLTPCTPLASLLGFAAHAGGAGSGAAYGLAFGLGTTVTPILVLAPLAASFGRVLRNHQAWLSRWLVWASAAVLVLLGLRRLVATL